MNREEAGSMSVIRAQYEIFIFTIISALREALFAGSSILGKYL